MSTLPEILQGFLRKKDHGKRNHRFGIELDSPNTPLKNSVDGNIGESAAPAKGDHQHPSILPTTTTVLRPLPNSVPVGTAMYDTTLSIPIYSDGTNWKNAAGVNV